VFTVFGLQTKELLDGLCPNVDSHRQAQDEPTKHYSSAEELMLSLKDQLDEDIDHCFPIYGCGSYGAPLQGD
jgi:hypothetical protein